VVRRAGSLARPPDERISARLLPAKFPLQAGARALRWRQDALPAHARRAGDGGKLGHVLSAMQIERVARRLVWALRACGQVHPIARIKTARGEAGVSSGAGADALKTQLNANLTEEGLKAGIATNAQNANTQFGTAMASSSAQLIGDAAAASDRETKQELRETKGQLSDALAELHRMSGASEEGRGFGAQYPTTKAPDIDALDGAAESLGDVPSYFYEYKPEAQKKLGSAAPPGRRAGPMADDLRRTPLRDLVHESPDGTDMVDTRGLSLATAGAVGEQQREIEQQSRELDELKRLATVGLDEGAVYPARRRRRRAEPEFDFGY